MLVNSHSVVRECQVWILHPEFFFCNSKIFFFFDRNKWQSRWATLRAEMGQSAGDQRSLCASYRYLLPLHVAVRVANWKFCCIILYLHICDSFDQIFFFKVCLSVWRNKKTDKLVMQFKVLRFFFEVALDQFNLLFCGS